MQHANALQTTATFSQKEVSQCIKITHQIKMRRTKYNFSAFVSGGKPNRHVHARRVHGRLRRGRRGLPRRGRGNPGLPEVRGHPQERGSDTRGQQDRSRQVEGHIHQR